MKKILVIFLVAVSFAACTSTDKKAEVASSEVASSEVVSTPENQSAQVAQVDTTNAPVFQFEKSSYDFGQITEGEKVSYDFKFKNVGKSPLIITSASATCGCTTPEFPNGPVAPGQDGIIHVVFNSAGKKGMQNKVITVISNTEPSSTQLHLMGDVKAITKK